MRVHSQLRSPGNTALTCRRSCCSAPRCSQPSAERAAACAPEPSHPPPQPPTNPSTPQIARASATLPEVCVADEEQSARRQEKRTPLQPSMNGDRSHRVFRGCIVSCPAGTTSTYCVEACATVRFSLLFLCVPTEIHHPYVATHFHFAHLGSHPHSSHRKSHRTSGKRSECPARTS